MVILKVLMIKKYVYLLGPNMLAKTEYVLVISPLCLVFQRW